MHRNVPQKDEIVLSSPLCLMLSLISPGDSVLAIRIVDFVVKLRYLHGPTLTYQYSSLSLAEAEIASGDQG